MAQAQLDFCSLVRKVKLNLSDGIKIHVYADKIIVKKKKKKFKGISISKSLWQKILSNSMTINSAFELTFL